MATQPNAVLTVSSATCEDVLGVLSHLMRLLSQLFGSEPVSNLCGQQQWLKSVEDIFVANLWNACGGETVQRARKELLWYSVHRPFQQHHHAGQRIHLYFNSEKASLLFQGRRCWSPPAAWCLGGVWGRGLKKCWICVPGEHEEFRTRCHTRRCSAQRLCT